MIHIIENVDSTYIKNTNIYMVNVQKRSHSSLIHFDLRYILRGR